MEIPIIVQVKSASNLQKSLLDTMRMEVVKVMLALGIGPS